MLMLLGATSVDKIGEVQLSDEIGEGGKIVKKMNFTITFRYKIPIFSLMGPFLKRGLEIFSFSIYN